MNLVRKASVAVVLLIAVGTSPASMNDEQSLAASLDSITAADLRSMLFFLASDAMAGRDTNSQTNEIAASYIAHRFQTLGLQPAGGDGSYLQEFDLVQGGLAGENRLQFRRQISPLITKAVVREDFYPAPMSASGMITAPLVFVGYGITAPEFNHDDYRGIDVRDRIVVVLSGEPQAEETGSRFYGRVNSDYSRERHKIVNAQEHGVAGVLIVAERRSRGRTFAQRAASMWPDDRSRARYQLKIWVQEIGIPAAYISPDLATSLFSEPDADIDNIRKKTDEGASPEAFPINGAEATLETSIARQDVQIHNVLGMVEGSGSEESDETVIIGAHFDHVAPRDGQVRNGADDDGSGTVGLIELAEAFVQLPEKPKRSIIFAAWNAEERGLFGSYYYAEQPLNPLERTVAVLNMDMIGRNEEIPADQSRRFRGLEPQTADQNANAVNILGYSLFPQLQDLVAAENASIGLELKFRYDDHEQNLLRRSDQWPFIVKGVPALFFHTGLHPDYHTPGDTPDKINYTKMEKIVRLIFRTAWRLANQS